MLDQVDNFYLISLSILITFLVGDAWILLGEVTCESFLGVKGLIYFAVTFFEGSRPL